MKKLLIGLILLSNLVIGQTRTVTTTGGTLNYVPLWGGTSTQSSSVLYQTSSQIGLSTTTVSAKLHIHGSDATSSNYGLKVDDVSAQNNFYIANDGSVSSRLGYWLNGTRVLHSGGANASIYLGFDAAPSAVSTAQYNVAVGVLAGYNFSDNTNINNTAVGYKALMGGSAGNGGVSNVAIGIEAGTAVTTGYQNVMVGASAGSVLTTGLNNVLIGRGAGIGLTSGVGLQTGQQNILIGQGADVSATGQHNSIAIGYEAICTSGNQLVIGGASSYITNAYIGHSVSQPDANLNIGSIVAYGKTINTTAGDAATINAIAGRFRKDTSGTTFTLTNSYITSNSIIVLTASGSAIDANATGWTVDAGSGTATITYNAAPTANLDLNFIIIN